jgi:hypothetical protein
VLIVLIVIPFVSTVLIGAFVLKRRCGRTLGAAQTAYIAAENARMRRAIAAGLDEGLLSLSLPILVYMDNPYRCEN